MPNRLSKATPHHTSPTSRPNRRGFYRSALLLSMIGLTLVSHLHPALAQENRPGQHRSDRGSPTLRESHTHQEINSGDRPVELDGPQLFEQGTRLYYQGHLLEAERILEYARDRYRADGNLVGEAAVLVVLVEVYDENNRDAVAQEVAQRALEIYQTLGDRAGMADALTALGFVHPDRTQAIDFLEQALEIRHTMGDSVGEGMTLAFYGITLTGQQNFAAAQPKLEAALERLSEAVEGGEELRRAFYRGGILLYLGFGYGNRGQHEQALTYYMDALAILRQIGNRWGEGGTLNNIGGVYSRLGQYEQARTYYMDALTLYRHMNNSIMEATTLNNLGETYRNQGQYEQALTSYTEALAIIQELGHRARQGTILNNIGLVYASLGQYEQALASYQNALALHREVGNRQMEGTTLNNVGLIYANQWQHERALTYFTDALTLLREVGDRSMEGTTLNNMGLVYINQGQYEQALAALADALALRRDVGDRPGEGTTLNNIGFAYASLGQYEQALPYLTDALGIHIEVGNRPMEATTLNNLGATWEATGEPELAIVFFKQAVNCWEAIRDDIRGLAPEQQQSFTHRVSISYRLLANLLLRENRVLEAQRVLDLLRVQELDEYLQDVRSTAQTESGIGYWQIEEELLTLYQQVLDEAAEFQQLRTQPYDALSSAEQQRLSELRNRSSDVQALFFAFRDHPEVSAAIARIRETTRGQNLELNSYAQLQDELQSLPQRTVVLYPLILGDRLELVLIFPDAPPLRYPVAVTETELNRAIVAFGQALTTPNSTIEPLAQRLYTWLIAPLEETLDQQGVESIIYSPDGALRYVPLAALHDGENYLVQRFSISHITADSLTDFAAPPVDNRRLLAAACAECAFSFNVAQNPFRFEDLPFTEVEVTNLAAQFPDTSVLVNQAFSQDALENRIGSYGLIHLATHAAFITEVPQESFIVLGSGERISLQDIRNRWNLSHVGLVVLSACETAVGSTELGSGIELLGLGYQIQASGAQAVIASLWKISDGGTQVLMDAFYAALNSGYSKAEALQRAQIALITRDQTVLEGSRSFRVEITDMRTGQPLSQSSSLAHPYYWAPFILIGNGL